MNIGTLIPVGLLLLPTSVSAILVTPNRNVKSHVHVRPCGSTRQAPVAFIKPGEHLRRDDSPDTRCEPAAGWFHVRLPDGRRGYVSSEWVHEVVPDQVPFQMRFVDFGNGSAAILTIGGRTIVIDGGSDAKAICEEVGRSSPRGDLLLVGTCSRTEHLLGLRALANALRNRVIEVWGPSPCGLKSASAQFGNELMRSGVPYRNLECQSPNHACTTAFNHWFEIPEADFTVLYSGSCPEDISVVLRIDIGSSSFLFTGDIGGTSSAHNSLFARGAEAELVNLAPGSGRHPLKADVILVPAHGAATSSSVEFIQHVQPTFAIISGNPNQTDLAVVADRYAAQAVRNVLTTNAAAVASRSIICHRGGTGLECVYEPTGNR